MIGRKKDFGIRHRGSHPEGWARGNTTLKRVLAPVLQHSAMLGPRLSVGTTSAVLILVLSALPPVRLFAQGDVDRLALLFTSPLDEVGYVVGNILPDGFLLLRRVGGGGAGRTASPLFDQQLEGHRVTVFGARGAVPGVVAVKSTHLTRGRSAPGTPDPVFTVDNAYVDLGASSAAEVQGLGIAVLAPVSLAKRPQLYGDRLVREILQWMEGR